MTDKPSTRDKLTAIAEQLERPGGATPAELTYDVIRRRDIGLAHELRTLAQLLPELNPRRHTDDLSGEELEQLRQTAEIMDAEGLDRDGIGMLIDKALDQLVRQDEALGPQALLCPIRNLTCRASGPGPYEAKLSLADLTCLGGRCAWYDHGQCAVLSVGTVAAMVAQLPDELRRLSLPVEVIK